MPLEDDFSSQDSDHESGDEDNENPNDSPMMSIFASYYGIEESEADNKPKGTIDDVNFDPEAYVKKLLINETVEGLIGKDTEMVHEIRTLDGEMQKLVYDNYNKFITATETIKEMKNDVHGMDHDMEEVKLKMDAIAKSSGALDEVLHDKRSQVDKLVRVRRLLNRLEFLSELPERLAEMIENKLYKEAVQLYNKTISVLTRHQHVLSFKNIKERTELMMKDLTGKVILMLDDVTLEDVKLTQYVTVLRLMKAPRMKVMEKLLHAHKHRSMRMITQFNQQKTATASTATATGTESGSTSSLVKEMLTELTNARKFAQLLVVGLIEACKGIYDLFQVNYLEGTSEEQHLKEARQAHSELQAMISAVMAEYTKSMGAAFSTFFGRFNAHFLSQQVEYPLGSSSSGSGGERGSSMTQRDSSASSADSVNDSTAGDGAASSSSAPADAAADAAAAAAASVVSDEKLAAEFKSSELQDERNKWLSLARQSINDVIYLDSTQSECYHNCHYTEGRGSGAVSNVSYAGAYSEALLGAISQHGDVLQAHRVSCYLTCVTAVMPQLQALCQIKSGHTSSSSAASTGSSEVSRPRLGGRTHSSNTMTASSDPAADRATLTKNTAAGKRLLDQLVNHAVGSFADAARDLKSTVEIYEVSSRDVEEAVVALVSKHVERLVQGMEGLCGVVNHKYTFDPVAVKSTSLRSGQSGGGGAGGGGGGGDSSEDLASDDIDLIYCEPPAAAPVTDKFNEFRCVFPSFSHTSTSDSSSSSEVCVGGCLSLLFSGVLRRLLPSLWEELNNTLQELDLPTLQYRHELRSACLDRLTVTCELLLQSFVESNALHCASQLTRSQYEVFIEHYGPTSSSSGGSDKAGNAAHNLVNEGTLLTCKFLDLYALLCCVVLNEAPPPLKSHGLDRDLMRRGGGAAAARASVVGGLGHHNLQLDIERLFTQRIKVFDRLPVSASLDLLVGAVIKASLKSTLETIRCMSLPSAAYIQIQANATFMKQATSCLVKEGTDCENLVEQILSAIFSRYLDANEISSVSDGNELQLISKGVTEAFAKLHDRAVLVVRASG